MKKKITDDEFLQGLVKLAVVETAIATLDFLNIELKSEAEQDRYKKHIWEHLESKGIKFIQ